VLSFLLILVGGVFTARVPTKVKNVFDWTDGIFRVAVAVQTESHAVGLGMLNSLHLINPAMAFNAAYTTVNVGGVVKINIVWGLVYLDPFDRITGKQAVTNRSEFRGS
jgi:hypothetical protein